MHYITTYQRRLHDRLIEKYKVATLMLNIAMRVCYLLSMCT